MNIIRNMLALLIMFIINQITHLNKRDLSLTSRTRGEGRYARAYVKLRVWLSYTPKRVVALRTQAHARLVKRTSFTVQKDDSRLAS